MGFDEELRPITIFIPLTHYHPGYLRLALDSVVKQTRPDWHLLVVVSPSEAAHFREFLGSLLVDPRVRLILREGQRLAGAYNSAMRAARTEFIMPLMGDDLLAPETVEVFSDCIRNHPGADVFYGGRRFIDAEGQPLGTDHLPEPVVTGEQFEVGSPVKHPFCWRVSAGLACGGVDEDLVNFASDDYDFPWTMLDHGAVFEPVPKVLYLFRDHRDGYRLTTHMPRSLQRRGLRRILKKHGVSPQVIRQRVRNASRGYLRQSLFRNRLHQWIRERLGFDPLTGWREPYL